MTGGDWQIVLFSARMAVGSTLLILPVGVALAWLLARGPDVIPIPGTKRVKYLEENVGALNVKLSDAELQEIEAIFPAGAASGARYADMSFVNR